MIFPVLGKVLTLAAVRSAKFFILLYITNISSISISISVLASIIMIVGISTHICGFGGEFL